MNEIYRLNKFKEFIKTTNNYIKKEEHRNWLLEINNFFSNTNKNNEELDYFYQTLISYFYDINNNANAFKTTYDNYKRLLSEDDLIIFINLSYYINKSYWHYATEQSKPLIRLAEDLIVSALKTNDLDYCIDELICLALEYKDIKALLNKYEKINPVITNKIKKMFIQETAYIYIK